MTNPPPPYPPVPPGSWPPPPGPTPGPQPSWWRRTHTIAGQTLPRWSLALLGASALLLSCCALGALVPPPPEKAEPAAAASDTEPTTTTEAPATTTTEAAGEPARPEGMGPDGGAVLAAVRAAGIDVGEVRDNTGTCAGFGCTRLTTTDVLSIYEFDPGAEFDHFMDVWSTHQGALVSGSTFVRLADDSDTPDYDGPALFAALGGLGFRPAAPGPPPAAVAPPPPPPPPPPSTAAPAPAPKPTSSPTTARPAPKTTSTPAPRQGVTGGAFCSPAGAVGYTSTGKRMTCKTAPDDSRNRWR